MNQQTKAELATCSTCRQPILTGVDDIALTAIAEPIPLTRDGEIQAMATGRDCWRLDHDKRLWRTDTWRIASDRPFPTDHRVTTHLCHQPIPTTWTTEARPTPEGALF